MSRTYWLAAVVAVALLTVAGYLLLRPDLPSGSANGNLAIDATHLVVLTDEGERSFTVEIADDPAERQQGLMFREHMDDDHGMLFVFGETQQVGFWMKDTPLALDLIFIGQDGRIRAIRRGEPLSPATISPGVPVRFVFEVDVTDLILAQREVCAIDDVLIAEQPVRARVDVGPCGECIGDQLRGLGQNGRLREPALAG